MSDRKIFFATDIHGSEVCLRKFLNAGKFYGVDSVVMGGDITGKMIVPIVASGDGTFVAHLFGRDRVVDGEGLAGLRKLIADAGFYPHDMTRDEVDDIKTSPEKVEALFEKVMVATVSKWLDMAEDRLKGSGIDVFFAPGNDDPFFVDGILSSSELVINPDGRVTELPGGVLMISVGYSNVTPWTSPRELDEEALERTIEEQISKLDDPSMAIFNLHVPPKDTPIDQALALDDQWRPVMKGGSPVITGVGSAAVRNVIARHQPILSLHGHIHESRGEARIGRTLAVNPGSEYSEGVLRGVIITLNAKKGVKGVQFVSG